MSNAKITVAQEMAETLRELGVSYVFGIPSGNWVDFMEGFRQTKGIEFVLVSNEASGGFMADVHWRLTGKVAACFGTFGPGACNQSTGVCCSYLDRSPILAFSDEMSDFMINRTTQMNMDHQAFFKPITKWQTRLVPGRVREILYEAYRLAISEVPGPVYIGLPSGSGSVEILPYEKRAPIPLPYPIPIPEKENLDVMEDIFSRSKKPLLALGISSIRSGAREIIRKIAEKYQIPVVLTPMAKGMFPESHPCYAGVLAHALSDKVGRIHQQADLILGIGYDPIEINYEDWMPNVPLIHIDTQPADIDKDQYHLAVDVVGDVNYALKKLVSMAGSNKEWDMEALETHREEMFNLLASVPGKFGPRMILDGLRKILPRDAIMTCDVGAHLHLIGQAWKTYLPECQLMTNGGSSMGFGIPAAIAAKLSLPKRDVVCVTGDGGFLMMAGEMATVKRLGIKVMFIVLMDKDLSLIRIKQERKDFFKYGTSLYKENYISSNSYFGVPVHRVNNGKEYQEALRKFFQESGPCIIEAVVDKNEYEKLVLRGNK